MADACQNPYSCTTYIDITTHIGQICKEFRADTLKKLQTRAHLLRLSGKIRIYLECEGILP